ncbi:MAG TPA: NlpC/P60 family protein [Candidatus Saccharimonadales bacterium]|jgi:cell wall-associated NlpC family hydrolase
MSPWRLCVLIAFGFVALFFTTTAQTTDANAAPKNNVTVTVDQGETLFGIADDKCNISRKAIVARNPQIKNINVIRVGQKINCGATKHKASKAPAKRHHKASRSTQRSSLDKGTIAVSFAKKQLGEPYRLGSAGPNRWDCSGLTKKAWQQAGKSLPHKAALQRNHGKRVSLDNLQKGDLIFFYGKRHVGMYVGDNRFIHAPRPGTKVRIDKLNKHYRGASSGARHLG